MSRYVAHTVGLWLVGALFRYRHHAIWISKISAFTGCTFPTSNAVLFIQSDQLADSVLVAGQTREQGGSSVLCNWQARYVTMSDTELRGGMAAVLIAGEAV